MTYGRGDDPAEQTSAEQTSAEQTSAKQTSAKQARPEEAGAERPRAAGDARRPARPGTVLRIALALAGLAGIGWGVAGFTAHTNETRPANSLGWLAGGVILHDGLLVPAVTLIGLVLARVVPPPYRAVAQGALIVSGSVALASLPLWRGYGGAPGNPSVDPLPYGRNLLIVLAAVWAGAGLIMMVRAVRVRHHRDGRSRRAK